MRDFLSKMSPYKQMLSSAQHSVSMDAITGEYVSSHGYCNVTDGFQSDKEADRLTSMNCDWMRNEKWKCGGLIKDNDRYRKEVLSSHQMYYPPTGQVPVFCGEVGACQRRPGIGGGLEWLKDPNARDRNKPEALSSAAADVEENKQDEQILEWRYRRVVSTFHYTVWAAVLSRGAAAPLAWGDGKEFGEISGTGRKYFKGSKDDKAPNYPIDYYQELAVCRDVLAFLNQHGSPLWSLTQPKSEERPDLHVFSLANTEKTRALVWLVLNQHNHDEKQSHSHSLLAPKVDLTSHVGVGNALVVWINPWTAKTIPGEPTQALGNVATNLAKVTHDRPLAGTNDGKGPHECEDILLWVEKQ